MRGKPILEVRAAPLQADTPQAPRAQDLLSARTGTIDVKTVMLHDDTVEIHYLVIILGEDNMHTRTYRHRPK